MTPDKMSRRSTITEFHLLPTSAKALLAILDGPQIREDVVEKTMDPVGFRMTAWSESFAKLWLQLHGRRFCAYNRRYGPECPRAEKKGTDASIKRSQLRALQDLGRRLAGRRRPLLRADARNQVNEWCRSAFSLEH